MDEDQLIFMITTSCKTHMKLIRVSIALCYHETVEIKVGTIKLNPMEQLTIAYLSSEMRCLCRTELEARY